MARVFRALTALAAWAGLGIQLWILLTGGAFETPLAAVWRFLGFFTILTNLIVAVTATVSVIAPQSALGRFVDDPNARAGVLLYIATVGIIYHLLLAGLWAPEGWQLVADQLLHTATPVLVAMSWVAFDRKQGVRAGAIPAILVYPVGYAIYAVIRGAFDGFYPYFFIDVSALGYARVAMNIAGLAGAFLAGAVVVILLARFDRRSPVRTQARS